MKTPTVYRIIALPIPTPAGELYRLVHRHAHVLGDAGGRVLLWRPLGNPRHTDAVYRSQRTKAMEKADEASAAEYDESVARLGSEAHYIRGEVLEACKLYGVRQQELPLILFLAIEPVNENAVLHVDRRIFADMRSADKIITLLAEELSEQKMLGFATDGAFTSTSMQQLQLHLANLEQVIGRMVHPLQVPTPTTTVSSGSRPTADASGATTAAYAIVHSSEGPPITLTKIEYDKLVRDRDRYDFIIDGCGLKAYKRWGPDKVHRQEQTTRGEYAIIRDYILNHGWHAPGEFRPTGSSVEASNRYFSRARQKVDIVIDRHAYMMFKTDSGDPGEPRLYKFDPPDNLIWLLIDRYVQ